MQDVSIYNNMADPVAACEKIGDWLHKSQLLGCRTAEQGRVMALACMLEKKNPLEICRTFHIMHDGKLAMRADAMLAELRKAGGKFRWIESTDKIAVLEIDHAGQKNDVSYTIEDAQRAKLIKVDSGWTKNPDAMLRARVTSKAMRMLAPEIVSGYYTPEEVQDFAPEPVEKRKPIKAESEVVPEAAPQTPAALPKSDEAAPETPTDIISEEQRKLIFALYKETCKTKGLKISEAQFREMLTREFNIFTTKSIKQSDFEAIIDWIKAGFPARGK